jgi:flavin-dependent dehydrogenase
MMSARVIIVGAGPAGSSCAWKLRQLGIDCLLLDKQTFPRTKLCAGWITPQVFKLLQVEPEEYPYRLTTFKKFIVHIYGKTLSVAVRQYAIRRYEFDAWLLQRAGAPIHTHEVREIKKDGRTFIIDDQYRCDYLIGSGGTHCPVARTFSSLLPRRKEQLVATLEEEFPYDYIDSRCHLWFLFNKLPGYAWYVPKADGLVNIGIGGYLEKLKNNNDTIMNHWRLFIKELERLDLVRHHSFAERGYVYYVRNDVDVLQGEGLYLIGDAAGLATLDMGEGIGPAVHSGVLAANAVAAGKPLSLRSVKKYSFARWRVAQAVLIGLAKRPDPR